MSRFSSAELRIKVWTSSQNNFDEYSTKLKGIALPLYGNAKARTQKPNFLLLPNLPTYFVFFADGRCIYVVFP